MHNATVQQPLPSVSPNSNPTIVMLQVETGFTSKHSVVPFRCPCLPFIHHWERKRLWFPVKGSKMTYTAGHTKYIPKTDQRYHREIYLADNMLYKDQTIKIITASYEEWMMTRSEGPKLKYRLSISQALKPFRVTVPPVTGRFRGCTLRHWGVPNQSLGMHGPNVFDWTNVAMHNATVQQPLPSVSPNSNPTIVMLQVETGFTSKHSVVPFRCPCLPFIHHWERKRLWFPVKGK
ncbi:hypothetical protein TNCV_1442121 [Trichonephila clavipes]|uniref:Uncharacterized protein n=1 Tax=Trichonephila clavipes TaxID=2585209 RepID=A0A8X6V287_TRICX|nr:hypothetical protein TNCV_1442121 [Trichonephila clavipes]